MSEATEDVDTPHLIPAAKQHVFREAFVAESDTDLWKVRRSSRLNASADDEVIWVGSSLIGAPMKKRKRNSRVPPWDRPRKKRRHGTTRSAPESKPDTRATGRRTESMSLTPLSDLGVPPATQDEVSEVSNLVVASTSAPPSTAKAKGKQRYISPAAGPLSSLASASFNSWQTPILIDDDNDVPDLTFRDSSASLASATPPLDTPSNQRPPLKPPSLRNPMLTPLPLATDKETPASREQGLPHILQPFLPLLEKVGVSTVALLRQYVRSSRVEQYLAELEKFYPDEFAKYSFTQRWALKDGLLEIVGI